MPWTFHTPDGTEVDLRSVAAIDKLTGERSGQMQTAHSSAMWQDEAVRKMSEWHQRRAQLLTQDAGHPGMWPDGECGSISYAECKRRHEEFEAGAAAERERCAKVVESIDAPVWTANEWGEVGPDQCGGSSMPAVDWTETRAFIAKKIREGAAR